MKIVSMALIAALALSEIGIGAGLARAAERPAAVVSAPGAPAEAAAAPEAPSPAAKAAAQRSRAQGAPASGRGGAASGGEASAAAERRPVVPVTPAERELLAHLVHAEAGNQPLSGRIAVAAVVLNRVKSGRFGRTVADVIYAPGEFESVGNYYFTSDPPTAEDREAVALALQGVDPSRGALYFFEPSKTWSPFLWSQRLTARIGAHFFAR
ncbi:MAG: cell wall hydrolase [Firmicutes bacterium]|nr:cell wall hydrolase [Bacillota bacterium]